jgi:osmotically-inducible protein OsmY
MRHEYQRNRDFDDNRGFGRDDEGERFQAGGRGMRESYEGRGRREHGDEDIGLERERGQGRWRQDEGVERYSGRSGARSGEQHWQGQQQGRGMRESMGGRGGMQGRERDFYGEFDDDFEGGRLQGQDYRQYGYGQGYRGQGGHSFGYEGSDIGRGQQGQHGQHGQQQQGWQQGQQGWQQGQGQQGQGGFQGHGEIGGRGGGYGGGGYGGGGYGGGGYASGTRGGASYGGGQSAFGRESHEGGFQGGFQGGQGNVGRGRFEGRSRGGEGRWGGGESRGFRGKGPKGYMRSDERIREEVCDQLEDADIDPSNVTVNVESGEVTLSGTIGSREEKREIEDIVFEVRGVKDVNNQIRIESESEAGAVSESERARKGNGRSRSTKSTSLGGEQQPNLS